MTVPPLGVAPPAVKSLTVAVKVTAWPWSAAAVEAMSEVGAVGGVVAVIVTVTAGVSSRKRLLSESAMNRSPAESTATGRGAYSSAAVAGPLSPV